MREVPSARQNQTRVLPERNETRGAKPDHAGMTGNQQSSVRLQNNANRPGGPKDHKLPDQSLLTGSKGGGLSVSGYNLFHCCIPADDDCRREHPNRTLRYGNATGKNRCSPRGGGAEQQHVQPKSDWQEVRTAMMLFSFSSEGEILKN